MAGQHAVIIGAGFGGLSAAAHVARAGYRVTLVERNTWVGGRAQVLEADGYRFDMGPSWYWMPGEHDRWFSDLGFDRRDFYGITRVDPSYRVYFGDTEPRERDNVVDIPADAEAAAGVFERYESGAGDRLTRYLSDCERRYSLALRHFIYKNYRSLFDFVNRTSISNARPLAIHRSYGGLVREAFGHPYLRKILQFPVVFLGSAASNTPAVYTLMNYVDFMLGTWYPDGGFSAVAEAMRTVCERLGVEFRLGTEVTALRCSGGRVTRVALRDGCDEDELTADVVVANADYPHVELDLLAPEDRSLGARHWRRKALSPAVLNFYLGLDRRMPELAHHTFFFDADWDEHFDAVYRHPRWVENPLFYVHVPSVTDEHLAPGGHEVVYVLVPLAPGLEDTAEKREHYYRLVLDRMEARMGVNLRDHVVFRRSYALDDFRRDYNAYRGTAFGLGQTLLQTAWFRPANRSKKLGNLYYCGHYTVPGTGTTMSTISGVVAAQRILEDQGMARTIPANRPPA
ncbi:MAG: phytoene desaturase family protein [Spirochaetaceae bacterium]